MEDLVSRIDTYNCNRNLTCCVVSRMEVVMFYLSTDVDFAIDRCTDVIRDSEIKFRYVDNNNLGLFSRLTYKT